MHIAPPAWSLRSRLVACITLVLVTTLAVGTALSLRGAARLVGTELQAAVQVAANGIHDDLTIPADDRPAAAPWRKRVADFTGERHVIARLLDRDGQELARSVPRPPPFVVPQWFHDLLTPSLPPQRIGVPGGTLELIADPANELAERWSEFAESLRLLGLFCLLAAGGVIWTTEWAMRPLRTLANGFRRIEAGDYAARLAADGPPEVGHILREFNRMAARLAETEAQNRRLNLHLSRLQEEERADLARDLHDEVGPLLFAVTMHAATVQQLADGGHRDEIALQVGAIQDAARQMQKRVRAILGQLRPPPATANGLAPAIEGLLAFWRGRHREIDFRAEITLPPDAIDDEVNETIYRIAQESLTNAVRHGRPRRIAVQIGPAGDDAVSVRVADDGTGAAPPDGEGFGLLGMRERVAARGGTLTVAQGRNGWTVTALLPLAVAQRAAAGEVAA